MKRLFERIFGFLGVGYGWCGGCSDPDCDDCATEWSDESRRDDFEREVLEDEPTGYDGFGAPIYKHQEK
jgi:hypothetical protein